MKDVRIVGRQWRKWTPRGKETLKSARPQLGILDYRAKVGLPLALCKIR